MSSVAIPTQLSSLPDASSFGPFGETFVPETLVAALQQLVRSIAGRPTNVVNATLLPN